VQLLIAEAYHSNAAASTVAFVIIIAPALPKFWLLLRRALRLALRSPQLPTGNT
jgi:hypothetical protein